MLIYTRRVLYIGKKMEDIYFYRFSLCAIPLLITLVIYFERVT